MQSVHSHQEARQTELLQEKMNGLANESDKENDKDSMFCFIS